MERQQSQTSSSPVDVENHEDDTARSKSLLALPEDGESHSLPDHTANRRSVYKHPDPTKLIAPIPEYEGAHRFDPKAIWTKAEERRLVRRIDLRLMPCVCLMYFGMQIDRRNIRVAVSDNMLDDLNLNTNDYNNGNVIFYICFLCAMLPSQLVSKRLGPDVWLPIQMILWSIVATSQCRLDGRASFFVTRALIGVLEGGFVPDIVLLLSYFYKSNELGTRLSWFWTCLILTNVSGSLIGYGILRMRGLHGWGGWRYLFLIEGVVTLVIGFFSLFWLPASPTQTRGVLRGKNGWFTEREEIILVNRILRDDPSKGDMHNRQALRLTDIWASLMDYDNWGLYLIGLFAYIPGVPPGTYLTLNLRSLGFSTLNANLLTIPAEILAVATTIIPAEVSRTTNERGIVGCVCSFWMIPLLVPLIVLPDDASPWVRFAILTLLVANPYTYPIVLAWSSANSNTVRTRTVSAALNNIFLQVGNIIASYIYVDDDKPYYRKGNKALIGLTVWNCVLFVLVKQYYIKRNKYKAARWNAMSAQEQAQYLETTTDKGNKRLDVVFVH